MSDVRDVVFVGAVSRSAEPFEGAQASVDAPAEIARALDTSKALTLVTYDSVRLIEAVLPVAERKLHHQVLLLEPLSSATRLARVEVLRRTFSEVFEIGEGMRILPLQELRMVLASPDARDLAIGVARDSETGNIVVLRGNLETLVLSERDFVGRSPAQADFSDLEPIDCGQTIRAGEFEAASDALLYEHDPDFRRRARERLRASEQSLGASIRRLRKQRGLRQHDFPGVSRKQIARIESGETRAPHGATLRIIAATLGVDPEALSEY